MEQAKAGGKAEEKQKMVNRSQERGDGMGGEGMEAPAIGRRCSICTREAAGPHTHTPSADVCLGCYAECQPAHYACSETCLCYRGIIRLFSVKPVLSSFLAHVVHFLSVPTASLLLQPVPAPARRRAGPLGPPAGRGGQDAASSVNPCADPHRLSSDTSKGGPPAEDLRRGGGETELCFHITSPFVFQAPNQPAE